MDHPLHQYPHTSRKTYLDAQHLNPEMCWESYPCGAQHTPPLTEKLFCHKAGWVSSHCHGNKLPCTFLREGYSTRLGTTCSLHNDYSFPEHVWHFSVNVLIKTLHPWSIQFIMSFGRKMCDWKLLMPQVSGIMKTRKEWGGTPYEQLFTWKGIFRSWKISTDL